MQRYKSSRTFRLLALGPSSKLMPPPRYKGGGEGLLQPLLLVFAVLQYLENIILLIDSLSYDLQDEVNIMGYDAAGGPS